jgi:transposase
VVLEISAAKWLVASFAGPGRKIRRKALTQDSPAERIRALLDELVALRRHFGLSQAAPLVVAYEAGQEGFWLVRALAEHKVAAQVINPSSLQIDRRARRAKTDRLDAESLVLSLWRFINGDETPFRMVRVPSEQVEDEREWQRERDRLEGERRGCTDRIRKKLRTHGIWKPAGDWRAQLRAGTVHGYNGALGSTLQAMLVMELERLETVERLLGELEQEQQRFAPATTERITRLNRLRGIGKISARGLALRLFWREFDNRRQVGSCVGMVSSPYDSGLSRVDQGITKEGDRRLRANLVELAWLWLRHQPDSAITRWFAARTQGAGKRSKRIMIVAVARRLAIALWRYLRFNEHPEGAKLRPQAA